MTSVLCWLGFPHKYEKLDQLQGHAGPYAGAHWYKERCKRCGDVRVRRSLDVDLGVPLVGASKYLWALPERLGFANA